MIDGVLDDLPDPVRVISRGGEVIYRNEAARLTAPDGLGHMCKQENRGKDASCPECQMASVFTRAVFLRWHVVVPREGRKGDYFEVTLSPVRGEDEQVTAVLEVLRDVTMTLGLEQYLIGRAETTETELRQRDEEKQELAATADTLKADLDELRDTHTEILYEDRLEALSQVVAALAHEVHTPLGAMISSADLLSRTIAKLRAETEQAPEPQKKRLKGKLDAMDISAELMVEGAKRIEGIVRALRIFSRLDEAPRQYVDLHEGIESTLQLLRHRMEERIRVQRNYGELPEVLCRADAVNQVFMNLLHNATQAIPENGTIRVATRREGSFAVIEVIDDGEGIPEERRARLFELGFTTKRGRGGAGIGLALSQRIVREHGGSIEVESSPGDGSTFRVRLPIGMLEGAGG